MNPLLPGTRSTSLAAYENPDRYERPHSPPGGWKAGLCPSFSQVTELQTVDGFIDDPDSDLRDKLTAT
jgi:hypothetical protein